MADASLPSPLDRNHDPEVAASEKVVPQPIPYANGAAEERPKTAVELEQERHRARASKFGVDYVEPRKDLLLSRAELRTEIARQRAGDRKGFAVGIDLFSEEEKAKKQQRAQRYGLATVAKDETDEERKRRLRAERFGVVEQVVPVEPVTMEVDALEVRLDVPDSATLRQDTLHVYGTDTLSTKDVLRYFTGYGPSFVEWINDSCCNVVFEDGFAAKRALLSIGTREPGAANEALPAPWYAGKPFERGDVRLPLTFRIACTADVKPEEGVVSRHLWQREGGRGQQGRWGGRGQQAEGEPQQTGEDWGQRPVPVVSSGRPRLASKKRLRNEVEQHLNPQVLRKGKVFGKARNRKRGKVNEVVLVDQGKAALKQEGREPQEVFSRFDRTRDDEEDDE